MQWAGATACSSTSRTSYLRLSLFLILFAFCLVIPFYGYATALTVMVEATVFDFFKSYSSRATACRYYSCNSSQPYRYQLNCMAYPTYPLLNDHCGICVAESVSGVHNRRSSPFPCCNLVRVSLLDGISPVSAFTSLNRFGCRRLIDPNRWNECHEGGSGGAVADCDRPITGRGRLVLRFKQTRHMPLHIVLTSDRWRHPNRSYRCFRLNRCYSHTGSSHCRKNLSFCFSFEMKFRYFIYVFLFWPIERMQVPSFMLYEIGSHFVVQSAASSLQKTSTFYYFLLLINVIQHCMKEWALFWGKLVLKFVNFLFL